MRKVGTKAVGKILRQFAPVRKKTTHANKNRAVWVRNTKTGPIEVPIKDMSDPHLLNAILFMQEHADTFYTQAIVAGYSVLSIMHGEMAVFYTQREIEALEEKSILEFLEEETMYPALCQEAKKRGLCFVGLESWNSRGFGKEE